MTHTWLEISRSAFYHNIANIKSIIGTTKLGFMLKADAYGHGLIPMAQLAQEHPDVDYIFTALTSDALKLRASGVTKPICVLVFCDSNLEDVIANDIEMIFYDRAQLPAFASAAKKVGKPARIHLKVDTGMSRLGMLADEAFAFFEEIKKYPEIKLVGVMTHLCDADDPSEASLAFTQQQLDSFDVIVQHAITHFSASLEVIHACASAGIIFSHNRFSLVRVGEAPYGCMRLVRVATNMFGYFKPTTQRARFAAIAAPFSLRPILTWKTRIVQLKVIPAGSCVGYNRTHCVQRETIIAMLPIGYFDGYHRGLSNCGTVVIRGFVAPVIGRVSMNLCTIDVTDVPGISVDDEVILMGDYDGITADDIAKKTGTLNLVILTGLHAGIKRIVVE